jgi:cobalt/nickel transport system permease protein
VRDRIILALYLVAVLVITLIHDLWFLAGAIALAFLLSGRDFVSIAKRAARAVLFFSSVVTVSYCIVSGLEGNFSGSYVLLITMRVFLLTFLTFLLAQRANPVKALGFSRTLLFMASLAQSQVLTWRRILLEFQEALESRSLGRLRSREIMRHAASTGAFLVRKSMADTREIAHAMRSRGFFND